MTVSSELSRKTYVGNGVTTSFGTNPVVFFDAGDLTVYVVTTLTGAVVATLTLGTHYTVSGGDGGLGTVNLAGGSSPYGAHTALQTLVIVRELDIVQSADFVNNDSSDAEVAEDAIDRLTMICQELNTRLDRSFVLPDSDVSGASTTIPTPAATSLIGWSGTGLALQNYSTSALGLALTTAFTLTLLDDPNAETFLSTLVDALPAETDPALADKILVDDVSEGAYNTVTLANLLKVTYGLRFGGALVVNGKITRSVAASALTIALKGLDGNDPSATNPVYVLLPTLTSNVFDGGYTLRAVTSALSTVISSGSTAGHTSAVASALYIYLIDNAGTLELAWSSKFFGGVSVQSSTAEGGAGAADTATVLYSTTARSNVAAVCLQRWKSTQTTAGTWAATTGEVQLFPFPQKDNSVQVFTASGTYTKPWDALSLKVQVQGGGGGGGGLQQGVNTCAGGGGAGGYVEETLSAASVGATETVTVGTAAAGGVGGASPTGGTTGTTVSFGGHCSATGGAGGAAATAGSSSLPGAGGTGSGGDVNVTMGVGYQGVIGTVGQFGGNGASSRFGGGGRGGSGSQDGQPAGGYGAGGGGAVDNNTAARNGGAGTAGIVVVEEKYA